MATLSMLALAQTLAKATETAIVVVDAHNAGGVSNWSHSFPGLDGDAAESLGEPFAMTFDDRGEAQAVFSRLCRDAADGSSLIGGDIHYVARDDASVGRFAENATVQTVSFDIGEDKEHPVFAYGSLGREVIVDRI